MIILNVYGTPRTAGSLKSFGKNLVHSSKLTIIWEDFIRWNFINSQYNGMTPFSGAVKVGLVFYFNRAKGHFKKDGSLSAEGLRYPYPSHMGKRDLDKLTRAVFDALTKYAYEDDGQIVQGSIKKIWGEKEGVKIRISEIT